MFIVSWRILCETLSDPWTLLREKKKQSQRHHAGCLFLQQGTFLRILLHVAVSCLAASNFIIFMTSTQLEMFKKSRWPEPLACSVQAQEYTKNSYTLARSKRLQNQHEGSAVAGSMKTCSNSKLPESVEGAGGVRNPPKHKRHILPLVTSCQ